jgi:hypothetical protein
VDASEVSICVLKAPKRVLYQDYYLVDLRGVEPVTSPVRGEDKGSSPEDDYLVLPRIFPAQRPFCTATHVHRHAGRYAPHADSMLTACRTVRASGRGRDFP